MFGGTMRGFNSDELLNRTIRGTVQVMSDGNIRWSFVSSVRVHDVNKQNSTYSSRLSTFRFQCITATTSGGSIGSSPCEFLYLITLSSSEGVQIGGVCSAAGVVGAWSGARHDQGWSRHLHQPF
jgi:hypothetical protein